MQHRQRSLALITLPLAIGTTLCIEASINSARAQIVPDGTLGAESSVVTPINGEVDRIDGGATRGANLFHSFQDFNVGEGRGAYFSNPAAIENILSRVTGSNLSRILGTLGVLGDANLFFINPNGIVFGPNARLDVRGSFVGSTADGLVFGNGFEFSATNPQAPPLLTINIPIGLNFRSNQPGVIANAGNLAVGQDLTLSAGNLDLQGQLQAGRDLRLQATDTVRVRDSVANPFVALAGGKLVVQGNQGVDIFALNHPDSGFFSGGDMVLRSANPVGGDAHYWSGGSFRIEQLDGTLGNWFSPFDPIIRASGDVSFDSYEGASLHILAGGSVTIPGNVTITRADETNGLTQDVRLSDGTTVVNIDGSAEPTLDIRAGTIAFGTPGITPVNPPGFSPAPPGTGGTGTSANITIGSINNDGGVVFLTNQYQPNPLLTGNITVGSINTTSGSIGDGGAVTLDSRDDITINESIDSSFDFSFPLPFDAGDITLIANGDITLIANETTSRPGVNASASGDGGDITLSANETISIADRVIDSLSNSGNAGNISLQAGASLSLTNSILDTTSSSGNTGNISLQAGASLSLTDNSRLLTSPAEGSAVGAGNISLLAEGSVEIANSQIAAFSGSGQGGKITLEGLDNLEVINSRISTSTQSGQAGDITVNASESIRLSGIFPILDIGGLEANATSEDGNAGSVTINTSQLTVKDGASSSAANISGVSQDITLQGLNTLEVSNGSQITASTETGQAGSVSVNAEENPAKSVELSGQGSRISVKATGEDGDAGSVTINTRQMTVSDGARVTVSSPKGQAGDLKITADSLSLDRGRITAETGKSGAEEEGANITLEISDLLILRNESLISAQAFDKADGGNITILNATGFVIAFPPEGPKGSDIIAKAVFGSGGRIKITTQGLFGIEKRERLTPLNDITASSEFGLAGIVEINTSGIDPTRGLTNLPEETVESEVAEGCQAEAGEPDVTFYNIGRGGLPPRPDEPLRIEALIVPLIPFDLERENETVQAWEEIFTISEMKGKFSLTPACRDK